MKFNKIRVPYLGRDKYGVVGTGDSIKSIVQTYMGGVTSEGGSGGSSDTSYGGDENRGGNSDSFFAYLSKTSNTFEEGVLLATAVTDTIYVHGFRNMDEAQVFVGDISSSANTNYGITGFPSVGLSATTYNNGTKECYIEIKVSSSILVAPSGDTGTLRIPVAINLNDNPLDPYLPVWYQNQGNCKQVWLTYNWTINRRSGSGGDGESAYYLSLTNDNATINCDSQGNIYSGAVKPTCQAKLYYGSERQSGATYDVNYDGASGVTGLTSIDGILTLQFESGFTFPQDVLHISVSGKTGGVVRDVKIMNVAKVKDGAKGADGASGATGASGQSAVSYWIVPNYNEIIYDRNTGTFSPSAITYSAYTQVGGNPPESATNVNVFWTLQNRETLAWSDEQPFINKINVNSAMCISNQRLRLNMRVGVDPTIVDQEDIDIMTDGMNGVQGQQGERGAVIRGPYDYYVVSGDNRCWCAGEQTLNCDDCKNWIDVVYKDGDYYRCVSGYQGYLTAHFPEYWDSATTYDFVATRVLLAENAKINFLTNNELYLLDESGNTTGGARGGSGITFWAGGDISGNTNNLPFRVMTDGTMYAMNGVFGGYIRLPFTDLEDLAVQSGVQVNSMTYNVYSADNRAYLIAYPYINDINRALKLPAPSSGLNGFTYDIVIHPALSQMERPVDLNVYVSGGTEITSYAFSTYKSADNLILTSGRFQITCIPASSRGAYKWALISASGNLVFRRSGYSDEYVSTLLATSNDTQGMINNVHTYTGNKPSSWSDNTTMYVKK